MIVLLMQGSMEFASAVATRCFLFVGVVTMIVHH